MLTVSLLVCAVLVLIRAADVPEAEAVESTEPVFQQADLKSGKWSGPCPSGWIHHNGRCFIYVSTAMTWANAERNCQIRGGNLASVHSYDEYRVIQAWIWKLTHRYPETWLGGYDAAQEGTWFWSDGSPFTFLYWDVRQPDNWRNGDCLVMNFGSHKKFDDQACHYWRPFVCAQDLNSQ